MAFLEDIWTQNFINFFASPLKIREYLSGLIITSMITSIIGYVVMIGIAWPVFGYNALSAGLMLIPFMAILLLFGVAMGVFVSAVVFRLGPSAEWLGWPIPLVLSLFAGVYYPISTLPPALGIVARVIPPSYVFESFRTILTDGVFPSALVPDLVIGAVLSAAYLLAASRFFVHIYEKNLKSGSIARFNAEAL